MEEKIINKLSLNIFVISGTILGGYVLSNNPIVSNEMVALTAACVVSGLTYVKTSKK